MIIEGSGLSPAAVAQAARGPVPDVVVSASARSRVEASFVYAATVAATRPVYGRSTGVGANRTVPVTDPAGQADRLLHSHATSAGPLRSPERVRAMLIIRLNQLAAGGSGIDPAVVDALAAMIAGDARPPVREYGSIGTGDLSALAVTALALSGSTAGSAPLPGFVRFGVGDALPFLSSNAATLADAALALADLRQLADATLAVAALTAHGVDGNPEAYSRVIDAVTPFPGARRVALALRELTGSIVPARIQDPFGLRTLPQVHGPVFDALDALESAVAAMINAPSENPVFLPPAASGETSGFAHHGGFYAASLTSLLDAAVLAVARSAELSLARLGLLVEPSYTGQPAFLADGHAGSSGVMVVEYVTASALGSLRALAAPAALQTVSISRGAEESAGFASLAARQALDAVAPWRTVLAGELVAAVRCLRMRAAGRGEPSVSDPGPPAATPALRSLLAVCAGLPSELADRDLSPDLEWAEAIVASPAFGA